MYFGIGCQSAKLEEERKKKMKKKMKEKPIMYGNFCFYVMPIKHAY